MPIFLALHVALVLVGSALLLLLASTSDCISFILGVLPIFFSTIIMQFGFRWLMDKKQVALSVPLIVIKYAILGIIVYFSLNQKWLNIWAYSLGVGLVIVSSLLYGLWKSSKQRIGGV